MTHTAIEVRELAANIPDGWVLVPRKPTRAMKKAVSDAAGAQALAWGLAAWQEMIAAAPASPSKPEQAPSPVPQAVAWRWKAYGHEDGPWIVVHDGATAAAAMSLFASKGMPQRVEPLYAAPLSGGDTGKVEVLVDLAKKANDQMRPLKLAADAARSSIDGYTYLNDSARSLLLELDQSINALTAALRTLEGKRT